MDFTPTNPYKGTTATFTGHRPNKLAQNSSAAYKESHYKVFLPMLVNALEAYLNIGIDTFITGGAQGFDQLVFWAVHQLKERHPDKTIRNIVYVPFKGQESIWRGNDIFGPTNYRKMLELADDVEYCTDLDNSCTKNQIAQALDYRNHCMCRSSSRLCSLWSNSEFQNNTLTPGGTANCVKFATSQNMYCDKLVYDFNDNGLIILV